ncbi:uncharacterized protein LOC121387483 [Gigantopelta aegis]|uniref:uncharacterized protein LOC121387483 n=1 Tax=Gigantopelta aegis TaxID=1735272 RepID=UPI001B8895FF|nr:uncharacterized protein LOC121387483 [Gigantopelta aegis]
MQTVKLIFVHVFMCLIQCLKVIYNHALMSFLRTFHGRGRRARFEAGDPPAFSTTTDDCIGNPKGFDNRHVGGRRHPRKYWRQGLGLSSAQDEEPRQYVEPDHQKSRNQTCAEQIVTSAEHTVSSAERKCKSAEQNVSSAERKLTSVEWKLTSVEPNVSSAIRNVSSPERKLTPAEQKLTSAEWNLTSTKHVSSAERNYGLNENMMPAEYNCDNSAKPVPTGKNGFNQRNQIHPRSCYHNLKNRIYSRQNYYHTDNNALSYIHDDYKPEIMIFTGNQINTIHPKHNCHDSENIMLSRPHLDQPNSTKAVKQISQHIGNLMSLIQEYDDSRNILPKEWKYDRSENMTVTDTGGSIVENEQLGGTATVGGPAHQFMATVATEDQKGCRRRVMLVPRRPRSAMNSSSASADNQGKRVNQNNQEEENQDNQKETEHNQGQQLQYNQEQNEQYNLEQQEQQNQEQNEKSQVQIEQYNQEQNEEHNQERNGNNQEQNEEQNQEQNVEHNQEKNEEHNQEQNDNNQEQNEEHNQEQNDNNQEQNEEHNQEQNENNQEQNEQQNQGQQQLKQKQQQLQNIDQDYDDDNTTPFNNQHNGNIGCGDATSPFYSHYRKHVKAKRHYNSPNNSASGGDVIINNPFMDKQKTSRSGALNPKTFNLNTKGARFFVIKSFSEVEIRSSIHHGTWSSTRCGNRRLDLAIHERQGKGPVILFFVVCESGCFSGVAQMVSAVGYEDGGATDEGREAAGSFKVRWIYVKDVPSSKFCHIRLATSENVSVVDTRDAQEVPPAKGKQMLNIIHAFQHRSSVLDENVQSGNPQGLQERPSVTSGGNGEGVDSSVDAVQDKMAELEKEIDTFCEKTIDLNTLYRKREMEEHVMWIAEVYGSLLDGISEADIPYDIRYGFHNNCKHYYNGQTDLDDEYAQKQRKLKLSRIFGSFLKGLHHLIPGDSLTKLQNEVTKVFEMNVALDILCKKERQQADAKAFGSGDENHLKVLKVKVLLLEGQVTKLRKQNWVLRRRCNKRNQHSHDQDIRTLSNGKHATQLDSRLN